MVSLKTSVRAATDSNFQHIQEIVSMSLSTLQDEGNDFINEFDDLVISIHLFIIGMLLK